MSDEILQRLAAVDLFEGLSPKVLKHIEDEGRVQTFSPGETVLEEGAQVEGWASFSKQGVCFYVIVEGTADVFIHGDQVTTLGPGGYFGEASLIDGKPRTATVKVGADGLRTFALTAWAFQPILEANPTVAITMLKVIVGRLRAAEARS